MCMRRLPFCCALLFLASVSGESWAEEMPWIVVSKDKKQLVAESTGRSFVPWGFNYDRDAAGRLLEDYWQDEWPKIETHFSQMKKLGANVVRIHLQFGRFMERPDKVNEKQLDRLARLLKLAERQRLYLDLTGLGCYHKKDVPAWYDKLGEKERWDAQANFWQAVASRCAASSSTPAASCPNRSQAIHTHTFSILQGTFPILPASNAVEKSLPRLLACPR